MIGKIGPIIEGQTPKEKVLKGSARAKKKKRKRFGITKEVVLSLPLR